MPPRPTLYCAVDQAQSLMMTQQAPYQMSRLLSPEVSVLCMCMYVCARTRVLVYECIGMSVLVCVCVCTCVCV